MRLKCCTAAIRIILLAIAFIGAICGGEARAQGGLSLGVRVQQEFYTPLVPVSRNFRTCFHTDARGEQVLGICTDTEPGAPQDTAAPPTPQLQRVPAAQPTQKSHAPQPPARSTPSK